MNKHSERDLAKIALVTGASSGIGRSTAERLAAAGYKVYGTSRRVSAADARSFEMLTLDVTSDESVTAAVSEVIRRVGRIDLLVNNAGFSLAPAAAEESSIEQAQSIFDTNFFGIVRMTRAVVPHIGDDAARPDAVSVLRHVLDLVRQSAHAGEESADRFANRRAPGDGRRIAEKEAAVLGYEPGEAIGVLRIDRPEKLTDPGRKLRQRSLSGSCRNRKGR